jgi:hypothetical protein
MVRTTTPTDGDSVVTRRVASIPSRCGICTSITTTSGCSSRASRTASTPSAAVPTTVMPETDPSSVASPSR